MHGGCAVFQSDPEPLHFQGYEANVVVELLFAGELADLTDREEPARLDAGLAAIESPRCRTSEGRIAERGTSGRASGTSGIDSRR